ncbi:MAG: glycogen debranching enzyme GlgX, partial [Chthoniobacter sp.]
ALDVRNAEGESVRDDTFLFLFNAYHEPVNFALPGKEHVNWEVFLNTHEESGFPASPGGHSSGDELPVDGRTLCILRLVKGSQDDARNVAWKHSQKQEPVAPPAPPKPTKHEPIDPTTIGPRFRARNMWAPKISDLAQGDIEPENPPLK